MWRGGLVAYLICIIEEKKSRRKKRRKGEGGRRGRKRGKEQLLPSYLIEEFPHPLLTKKRISCQFSIFALLDTLRKDRPSRLPT